MAQCIGLEKAIVSSFLRRFHADIVCIVGTAATHNVSTPIPMVRQRERLISEGRRIRVRLTVCKPKARIPFAPVGLVKLPDNVTDNQAILLSDIFPTGYMAAEMAEIRPGRTVAVLGCGPVGQFVIASLLGAGRIFAIDTIPSRLAMARAQGAEVIDSDAGDPVEVLKELTGSAGVDRAIDVVGVDATAPRKGPAAKHGREAKNAVQKGARRDCAENQSYWRKLAAWDAPSAGLGRGGTGEGWNVVHSWCLSGCRTDLSRRDRDEQESHNPDRQPSRVYLSID
jgi:hypothetical protein